MIKKIIPLVCLCSYVQAQQVLDCNISKIKWINDAQVNTCKFIPPVINSENITKIEFGDIVDVNSSTYHCYYVENKICNINDCKECNEKYIFQLMLSSKKFIAPTDETEPVDNCGTTLVNIPYTSIINPYNPIITTVHDNQFSIVNYTVKIYRKFYNNTGHFLHPGKVQRTIIRRGDDIFVVTMGDGSGRYSELNKSKAPGVWNAVDQELINTLKCKKISSSLFLFDVSGSMSENNKWANAKQAATSTLDQIFDEASKNNKTPSIALMSYSGGCVDNPTSKLLDFSSDKSTIKNAINNNLPAPNGGTPTPQAIQNAEAYLKIQLQQNNQCEGDLIILTDGQSSCGAIRPPGTYSLSINSKVYTSCQTNSTGLQLRYQTIGFDIPPGSDAEKDLQYLSSTHGGRYFHADNLTELKRAFEKISRVFVPIETMQSSTMVSPVDKLKFKAGIDLIKSRNYDTAFSVFKRFTGTYPDDSAGMYNYAQMSEATDRYKLASTYYSKFIQQNPESHKRKEIEGSIQKMDAYYNEYFQYQKEVVKKDLIFLDDHFKKLMNGQSIPLANEFTGFVLEKSVQYEKLPDVLGVTDLQITELCKEITSSFKTAQRRINGNSKTWDQDAIPVISVLYLKFEKLNTALQNLQPQQ